MLTDTVYRGPRFKTKEGILYFYDQSRNKWITPFRETAMFGISRNSLTESMWMQVIPTTYSNNNGYQIIRSSLITAISIRTKTICECNFNLQRNNDGINLFNLKIVDANQFTYDNLNIDLSKDDWLQISIDPNGQEISYPEVVVEYAYCI